MKTQSSWILHLFAASLPFSPSLSFSLFSPLSVFLSFHVLFVLCSVMTGSYGQRQLKKKAAVISAGFTLS